MQLASGTNEADEFSNSENDISPEKSKAEQVSPTISEAISMNQAL